MSPLLPVLVRISKNKILFSDVLSFYFSMENAEKKLTGSDSLWDGWSGDRIPVEAIFSASVQTDPGAHPAS
jgi:hypothetical protein